MYVNGPLKSALVVMGVLLAGPGAAFGDFATEALVERYRAFDLERNDGKGRSDQADSGTLAWGGAGIMRDYAMLWEVTQDPYWLEKIADHFRRIMASAEDHYGDGYLQWVTPTYSSAVAYAERLHNVSDARITPDDQKNRDGREAAKATGHHYLIEFHEDAAHFRVRDRQTWKVLADNIRYKDSADITAIEPFVFQITGKPHRGDRFMIRTIAPQGIPYVVHQGMFLYPTALFIEAVKSRPDLEARFGETADEFLAFINEHVFERHEQNWLDMGELGGAYRFEPLASDRYPNRILPHNQYAALARVWLVCKDVQGAHPLMGDRAEKMIRYFYNHLELDEENNAYDWSYWDYTENNQRERGRNEDTGHGSIEISLAVLAARRGVIFTAQDMQRFANTWVGVMWNQDEEAPRMASYVNGGGKHQFSPLYARVIGWTELAQWDKRVYDLALTAYRAGDDNDRTRWAPVFLSTARRAGVDITAGE